MLRLLNNIGITSISVCDSVKIKSKHNIYFWENIKKTFAKVNINTANLVFLMKLVHNMFIVYYNITLPIDTSTVKPNSVQ